LKIPKGALKPANGNTVTLEIKEAYSIRQMIEGGLVTESNGEPLSSGGMIYINAVSGENVTFTQPIKVAIPADYLQNGMQLYKGKRDNGKINWTDTSALPENKQMTAIDSGKILFQKCASCHAIDRDLTGPALAHFSKRFGAHAFGSEGLPPDWYHGFFTYPDSHLTDEEKELRPLIDSAARGEKGIGSFNSNDPSYEDFKLYVCNLKRMYGGIIGPAFVLNADEKHAIFKYIKNESDRRNLPLPGHAYLRDCIDSCKAYNKRTRDLQAQKIMAELKRKNLIKENGPLTNVRPDTTWRIVNDVPPPPDFDKKVSPIYYDAVYYQFSVESFGWYNIDMMMKIADGVQESELFAKVVGEYREKVETFLIIPSVKTYAQGGPADRNQEEFAFYHKDGKIPLPQNTEAYILAVTETENSIAFGLKKFITSRQQEIEVALHASSKEEFMEAMKEFDGARLHLKVADTKNATEVRKTDTTVKQIDVQLKKAENLKPKNCNCQCGGEGESSPIPIALDNK
jgi:hypothetical protein